MSMCVVVGVGDREFWKCQPATRENEVHYMATVVHTNSFSIKAHKQKGTTVSKLP